jgi:hypothetical protein
VINKSCPLTKKEQLSTILHLECCYPNLKGIWQECLGCSFNKTTLFTKQQEVLEFVYMGQVMKLPGQIRFEHKENK